MADDNEMIDRDDAYKELRHTLRHRDAEACIRAIGRWCGSAAYFHRGLIEFRDDALRPSDVR